MSYANYMSTPVIRTAERESPPADAQRLKNAVEQLERSQLGLIQRIEALQANQQRAEQLRQADIQRLSEQISSLNGELRKSTAAPPPRGPATSPAKSQKRNPPVCTPPGKPPPQGNPTPNGP
jgi:hypothetical protein